jgi:hypothetical protein
MDEAFAFGPDTAGARHPTLQVRGVKSMSLTLSARPETTRVSRQALWTGRILSTLAVLFLLVDGLAKVLKLEQVIEACVRLDVPVRVIPGLGAVLIAATLLYALPATSILGAIVLTGYLGGAVWTHVRMGGSVFPMVFPALFGALLWGGLYLREHRLRTLVPLRRAGPGWNQEEVR